MIHVVIIVVIAADNDQALREIYAAEANRLRQEIEIAHSRMSQAVCACGWTNWYETPGKAKMALAAHQQRRHKRQI